MYLDSTDFNGLPGTELSADEHEAARSLVLDGKLEVHFGDVHPNPYIKAFEPHAREAARDACRGRHRQRMPVSHGEHLVGGSRGPLPRPPEYTLRLAQGAPQLRYYAFDLSVLEAYRNDPRYRYVTDDISGRIVVSDEFYESTVMPGSDKVVLQNLRLRLRRRSEPGRGRIRSLPGRPNTRAPADLASEGARAELQASSRLLASEHRRVAGSHLHVHRLP